VVLRESKIFYAISLACPCIYQIHEESFAMMITPQSKKVIPFRPQDAKRVGNGCYYLDLIVWLNSEFIELGDNVGFNYGCWVNGFGGLTVGGRPDDVWTLLHDSHRQS
jgi:hypothetical protein